MAAFMGAPPNDAALRGAVEYASVENMRKLEARRVFWLAGGRMTPGDRSNPDSFKVRRAKVGGYRDYFDDEQVARIDGLVHEKLSPIFGYGAPASSS
jgi:alcohol sulfotransferase